MLSNEVVSKSWKVFLRLVIGLSLIVGPGSTLIAQAVPGTLLAVVDVPVHGALGVGGTFDGTRYIYINFSPYMLHIMTPPPLSGTGVLVESKAIVDAGGSPVTVSAIAWDPRRGQLWGAYNDRVYLINISTALNSPAVATLMFVAGVGGLALVDGLAYDGGDDTLYYSPDVNCNVYHFSLGTGVDPIGTLLNTVTPKNLAGIADCRVSGVVVGSAGTLYIGRDGDAQIRRIDKITGAFISDFVTTSGRVEDLTCDPVTYFPLEAILAKDAFNNLYEAFEVEKGTCPLPVGCRENPHAVCTITVGAGGLATVQAAYNAAVNDDVICLFANTTENVVLDGAKSLKITQCTTARVTADNNSLPVWTVSSTGKLTIIGPDAKDGSIGWLVEGDGHDIKGVRATGASQVGIKITGDNNSVSFNSVSGSPLGVKVEGTGNDVRGGTVSGNSTGVKFSATASNNRFRGAKVLNNTGPGIVVEGPGNTLDGNRVNGNTGDGIHVTATAAGTKLKSNQSGNPENGGAEYRLDVNAVNQGGNRADNIPIPKLSAPQKCAFFAAAGICE